MKTSAYARSSDPHTSHEAAAYVEITATEAAVLEALRNHFPTGGTAIEIAECLRTMRDNVWELYT